MRSARRSVPTSSACGHTSSVKTLEPLPPDAELTVPRVQILPRPRWRPVIVAGMALAVTLVGMAMSPGIPLPGMDLRLAVPSASSLAAVAMALGAAVMVLALVDAAAVRARRAATVVLVLGACALLVALRLLAFVGEAMTRAC